MAAPTPPVTNQQIGDFQKAKYHFQLNDKDKQPVQVLPDDPPITVTSSSPSVTIVPDAAPVAPDAASGYAVGGVPNIGNVLTATYTPGPTATAAGAVPIVQIITVDTVLGSAFSGTFTLDPPVSQ
jgi:hypothetical protein